MSWSKVRKAVIAAVGAGIGAAAVALGDGTLSPAEVGTIAAAIAVTAYATWRVPNVALGARRAE